MEPVSLIAALAIPAAVVYAWVRKAPLSLTLAVACIAIFLVTTGVATFAPSLETGVLLDLALVKLGGSFSGPWTWITSLFMHANFVHLLANLLFFIAFGPVIEDRIGSLRFGVLFLSGGLVATAVFVLLHIGDIAFVLLGSSGALSAVFGAFGRLYPRERVRMWLLVVPLPPMPAIYLVVGFLVLQLLLQPFVRGIAWEAHIAGVAFGFAVAPAILRLPTARRAARLRDVSALRPLVAGADLEEAYGHLAEETLPAAQFAWLERFAAKARCPLCGGPLRLRNAKLSSTCGWRLRL